MNELVSTLQDRFPGASARVTPRGITALYLAVATVARQHGPGEVVLPATVCPSVALAVHYAGMTPRFCDVEADTFCMSPRTLEPCLSERTKAVVFVYMFGKTFDICTAGDMARSVGAVVIEDLALAAGGSHAQTPLGRFGDWTILSFNDVKILSGAAGALISAHQDGLADTNQIYEALPEPLDAASHRELSQSFRNLTHGWYGLMRSQGIEKANDWLPQCGEEYRRLFLFKREPTEQMVGRCVQSLNDLSDNIARRRQAYGHYVQHLEPVVPYVGFDDNEVCWRLPVLMANHAQQLELIHELRQAGILVSDHYFPVSYLWSDKSPSTARDIGLRAVNFWVDTKVTEQQIRATCERVNRYFV